MFVGIICSENKKKRKAENEQKIATLRQEMKKVSARRDAVPIQTVEQCKCSPLVHWPRKDWCRCITLYSVDQIQDETFTQPFTQS